MCFGPAVGLCMQEGLGWVSWSWREAKNITRCKQEGDESGECWSWMRGPLDVWLGLMHGAACGPARRHPVCFLTGGSTLPQCFYSAKWSLHLGDQLWIMGSTQWRGNAPWKVPFSVLRVSIQPFSWINVEQETAERAPNWLAPKLRVSHPGSHVQVLGLWLFHFVFLFLSMFGWVRSCASEDGCTCRHVVTSPCSLVRISPGLSV